MTCLGIVLGAATPLGVLLALAILFSVVDARTRRRPPGGPSC